MKGQPGGTDLLTWEYLSECLRYTWVWWLKRTAIKSSKRGHKKIFEKKIDHKSSKNLYFWPFFVEKNGKDKNFWSKNSFWSESIQNGPKRILKWKSRFRKKIPLWPDLAIFSKNESHRPKFCLSQENCPLKCFDTKFCLSQENCPRTCFYQK